jgi:hypothetical protein
MEVNLFREVVGAGLKWCSRNSFSKWLMKELSAFIIVKYADDLNQRNENNLAK